MANKLPVEIEIVKAKLEKHMQNHLSPEQQKALELLFVRAEYNKPDKTSARLHKPAVPNIEKLANALEEAFPKNEKANDLNWQWTYKFG